MASNSVGITDPHARSENTGQVERTKTETGQTSQQKVDAKNLGKIKGWFTGAGVLPNF